MPTVYVGLSTATPQRHPAQELRLVAPLALLALAVSFVPATMPAQNIPRDSATATHSRPPVRGPIAETRVLASAREVRVLFPRDTAGAWGWSELRAPGYSPRYRWGILIEGVEGGRTLSLVVGRTDSSARSFSSLASLVAAGKPAICIPGMLPQCRDDGITASVEDGGVVIALRDSAVIAELFGLRPAWVDMWRDAPEEEYRYGRDSICVEYIAPQIPEPDSALLAYAAAARRRNAIRSSLITRYIEVEGRSRRWGALWLAVGDSVMLKVAEDHCHIDVCSRELISTVRDSGWTATDTSIVRLHTPQAEMKVGPFRFSGPYTPAVALRVGRTTIRVAGLHGPSDTMPSRTPVVRTVEREVVVTLPIERVEIWPRPHTVRVGERLKLRVQVLDRAGRVVQRAPASLIEDHGTYSRGYDATRPVSLTLDSPGRHVLIASFGARADTLIITAVERRKP